MDRYIVKNLENVFSIKGYLEETDFDKFAVPETLEQKKKRDQGQPVKSDLRAIWRWRFVWRYVNHNEFFFCVKLYIIC